MNKAFEKILEMIEENTIQSKDIISFFNECGIKFISADKVKKIVQEVAEKSESEKKKIYVHGYMVYRCEKCKSVFRMWCEKGIEEGGKPSPMVISHTCGGFAINISWLFRINKQGSNKILNYDTGYMLLPDGESYFANIRDRDSGVPIFERKK